MAAFQDRFEVDGLPVYVYARPQNLQIKGQALPLVLALNCATGNAQAEVMSNGWPALAL